MVIDLIQRLRTCPDIERRSEAFELARTGSDGAVSELIKMTQGEVRDYTPRTFRTLYLKKPIKYSPVEQFIGIEALGETRNILALDYLKHIYIPKTSTRTDSKVAGFQGIDRIDDFWSYEICEYPLAKGLNAYLRYELQTTESRNGGVQIPIPEEDIYQKCREIISNNRAHQLIRNAISKLESSFPDLMKTIWNP